MNSTHRPATLDRLEQLRAELAELAFTLESRGRLDAADVANSVSARLAELCTEITDAGDEAEAKWPEAGAIIATATSGQWPSGRRSLS